MSRSANVLGHPRRLLYVLSKNISNLSEWNLSELISLEIIIIPLFLQKIKRWRRLLPNLRKYIQRQPFPIKLRKVINELHQFGNIVYLHIQHLRILPWKQVLQSYKDFQLRAFWIDVLLHQLKNPDRKLSMLSYLQNRFALFKN